MGWRSPIAWKRVAELEEIGCKDLLASLDTIRRVDRIGVALASNSTPSKPLIYF